MKERIVKLIRRIFGVSEAAVAAEKKAERVVEKRRGKKTRRALVGSSALLAAALALPGCNALAQALGVDPRATAPAYSGVGVVVLGSPDTRVSVPAKTDQSGAVGATGSARTESEQTTTTEIPAEAVQAMVSAAQSLLAAGQTDAAAALLARVAAKQAAPKPAAAPPAAPAPAPAAPTAPESPAAPDAPTAPAAPAEAPAR